MVNELKQEDYNPILCSPFTVNNFVAPGKKNETQPKFHSTCQKPRRKRKGNILK